MTRDAALLDSLSEMPTMADPGASDRAVPPETAGNGRVKACLDLPPGDDDPSIGDLPTWDELDRHRPETGGIPAETFRGASDPSISPYEEIQKLRRDIRPDIKNCRRCGCRSYLGDVATRKLPLWRRAAELGLPEGEWLLGCCYKDGLGVEKDNARAESWFRKAAGKNNAYAQFHLGTCYARGRGVEKDMAEAVRWFRKAARGRCGAAQFNLAVCYEHGYGVKKDKNRAGSWYRKAAKQGNPEAKKKLEDGASGKK